MEEQVNNPVLAYGAKWGRRSESPAYWRNSTLKGVGVDIRRQIRG